MKWKMLSLILPWLIVGAFTVHAVIRGFYRVHNHGNIHTIGVEVYWDEGCTQPCTVIDWGWLYPGESAVKTVYLKLLGNTPAVLTITYGNWTPPEAGNFIMLAWDYYGNVINPGDVLPIEFKLTVNENISGIEKFSFDITIVAIG